MKDLVTQIKTGKKEAILEVEVILDKKKTKKMLCIILIFFLLIIRFL